MININIRNLHNFFFLKSWSFHKKLIIYVNKKVLMIFPYSYKKISVLNIFTIYIYIYFSFYLKIPLGLQNRAWLITSHTHLPSHPIPSSSSHMSRHGSRRNVPEAATILICYVCHATAYGCILMLLSVCYHHLPSQSTTLNSFF